jgi:CRP/FNR family cyclic AMP-dependent transcriptional regulator
MIQRSSMTTLAGKMMLQRSPLFRGLSPEILGRIAELATQRSYLSGEVVFMQGDPGDALYAVLTGKIRISAGTSVGRELFLNIMEPGDTFGEIALLDGGPRTASATAMNDSALVVIRRENFLRVLEREPRLALELLRLCGERLRWTSGLVEDAALLDAPARLAKRLVNLGQLHGERTDDGIALRISQEELASFLGLSRQVVNQYLQGWLAQGWVRLGRGVVTVRDEGALKSLAHS